jgi:hypothetical protein
MRWLFRRKTLLWIFIPLTVLLLCGLAALGITRSQQQAELDKQLARVNAREKNWRADDLVRQLPTFPPEKNSFRVIDVLHENHKFVLEFWPDEPDLSKVRSLPEQLPLEVADWLSDWHDIAIDTIEVARKLKDYPQGRHPIDYTTAFALFDTSTAFTSRNAAKALVWDSRFLCQLGKYEEAFANLRAIRNASASLHHEPIVVCNLISFGIDSMNHNLLMEILSQGQVREDSLAQLQKELQNHIQFNLLALGARGALAFYEDTTRKVLDGRFNEKIEDIAKRDAEGIFEVGVRRLLLRANGIGDRAKGIEMIADWLEAVEGPTHEICEKSKKLDESLKQLPIALYFLSWQFAPAKSKPAEAYLRHLADIRCSIVGLACERFRLANGRWPAKLEELQPKFIKELPNDPYNNQPLILKRMRDGIIIYAVGENGTDDGGDLFDTKLPNPRQLSKPNILTDNKEGYKQKDRGMRLWDPAARRRAPARLLLAEAIPNFETPLKYSTIPFYPHLSMYGSMGIGIASLLDDVPESPLAEQEPAPARSGNGW